MPISKRKPLAPLVGALRSVKSECKVVMKASAERNGFRGKVDVDVFGPRDKSAQVVCKTVQWAPIVRSEEQNDVCETRRCAVPFFFGGVFAGAVEDHAEAAW
jgi:hypothetical protein